MHIRRICVGIKKTDCHWNRFQAYLRDSLALSAQGSHSLPVCTEAVYLGRGYETYFFSHRLCSERPNHSPKRERCTHRRSVSNHPLRVRKPTMGSSSETENRCRHSQPGEAV